MIHYRLRAHWWPEAEFERTYIIPEQDTRFEADAWEETISEYLRGRAEVTILEIAKDALFITTDKIGTADQRRIRAILQREDWIEGKRTATRRPWMRKSGERGERHA
jgi:predicted P-loop ATPase